MCVYVRSGSRERQEKATGWQKGAGNERERKREREYVPINDAHALTPGHARLQYYLLFMLSYAKPVHGYHRLASGHGLPYVCRYRHRPAYLYQLRVVPAARIIM